MNLSLIPYLSIDGDSINQCFILLSHTVSKYVCGLEGSVL